jgi:para-aminobenzoate synthetase component I
MPPAMRMSLDQPRSAQVRWEELDSAISVGAVLEGLTAQDDPAVLESTALHESFGRYSILACRPLEVLCIEGDKLLASGGELLAQGGEEVWARLAQAFSCVRAEPTHSRPAEGPPYVPGWIGYIGYETGRLVERLPGRAVRDTHFPDLRLAFYDALAVHDAKGGRWHLTELAFDPASPAPPRAGEAAAILRRLLREARDKAPPSSPSSVESADPRARPAARAQSNFTPDQYRRAVARCVEYIAAGDIFQVNLSQRLSVPHAPPALDIYRALRRRNPAWYSALLAFEHRGVRCAVAGSSPELFLRVRGREVLTRPIKGTRPRVGEPGADAAAAEQLLASPKDNAELTMIVDLLRNDLGRVCEYGSVRVEEARRLETHPTVFHLVGTVRGRLREGVGAAELLRATFPGGSITGAPKIRAMEIIDEMELLARGVYTGCIGWVGVSGDSEWNIAIRTVLCDGQTAHVPVGGGIVADSEPAAEYDETLDKARAVLEAIAAAGERAGR